MLHYETTGSPELPPIVFLHGVGMDSWMWEGAVAHLTDFHCITVDLPGHGGSRDIAWVSLDDAAAQVDEIIRDRVPGGHAHLVGVSLGAYVGLTLAQRRAPLDSALLSGLHVEPIRRKWLVRQSTSLLAPLAKTSFVLRLGAQALRIPPEDFERYAEAARAVPTESFRAASLEAATYELAPGASHIETRILATAGEFENPAVHSSLRVLQARIPNARAAIAPEVGHVWPIEAPKYFARNVRDWASGESLTEEMIPLTDQPPANEPPVA